MHTSTTPTHAHSAGKLRRAITIVVIATLVMVGLGLASGTTAAEAASTKPTAIVSMGDSYISGEGGRWQGNSNTGWGNRAGTDRAAYVNWWWRYDASRVYGNTVNGCHRSDVAPILSTTVATDARINIACSGAVASNIWRSSNGGQWFRGEAPQADQLANLTQTYDVETIVLSIGGNDLGFADVILDCVLRFNTSPSWWPNTCNGPQQNNINNAMPTAMADVEKAIEEIEAVMAAAGDTDYRIILQSYPSPIPRGNEIRYSQSGWSRTSVGGCPFWNVDATWARDTLVPQISTNLQAVAASQGVDFLDLSDEFEGREVCSVHTSQGNSSTNGEWARYLSTGLIQGAAQESMHPNAIGQQATGTCLDLIMAAGPGAWSCTNTPGAGPNAMVLSPA